VSAPDPAKKLSALLKRLRSTYGEAVSDPWMEGCPEGADPLLWHLIFCFLAWESTTSRAVAANKRLHTSVVDYNELRVCLPDELVAMIGDRYPRARERVTRLRSALNDLYRREHAVSLAKLVDMPKRDARQVLDSLEGTPAFVSARMMLLSLGGHSFPMDERIHQALVAEDAAPADIEEAAGWLERQFRVGEAAPAYTLIEAWLNDRPLPKAPTRTGKRSGTAKGPRTEEAEEARPGRRTSTEKPQSKKAAKS
jgi:hypothetical protein